MISFIRLPFAGRAFILFALWIPNSLVNAADSTYPTRPIRIVVPFAPGGGLDALARIISPTLTQSMGQSWVVDNRAGAAGNLGAELVAHANPDGYTTLITTSIMLTVNPSLYKLPFNVQRDLEPITTLATVEMVVVVHPSVPVSSMKDLVALAKQKRGTLNYASAGVSSSVHLATEMLKLRTGMELTHVPYKGGGPAAAAVLADECQVMVGTVASTISLIKAGRLKALATPASKRSAVLPDLPTLTEAGFPGSDTGLWFALLAPGSTPKIITDRIRNEVIRALNKSDVQASMATQGLVSATSTQNELATRIKTESSLWAQVVKTAKITGE